MLVTISATRRPKTSPAKNTAAAISKLCVTVSAPEKTQPTKTISAASEALADPRSPAPHCQSLKLPPNSHSCKRDDLPSRQIGGLVREIGFLIHASNGHHRLGSFCLCRPRRRRRRHPEHAPGITHGLPLQPSPFLAASPI